MIKLNIYSKLLLFLFVIWKSDLTNKMKRSFLQEVVVLILLYGCTTWTLTKPMEKKVDGIYTRMLQAILNKSWRQHPTKHQLYGHLPSITKTIKIRWTRHAGHCWRSRDKLICDVLLWAPSHGHEKTGRPAWTYILQLIWDVALRTCRKQWMIGRSGKRGSEISVLIAWHDDDYYFEYLDYWPRLYCYTHNMTWNTWRKPKHFNNVVIKIIKLYSKYWLIFRGLFECISVLQTNLKSSSVHHT